MNSLNNLSHKTQLIATAVAASVATAGLIQAYNVHSKRVRRRELDEEIKRSITDLSNDSLQNSQLDFPEPVVQPKSTNYEEGLIREQLARNYAFFGDEGMAKIRQGRVVVVGCGGVGSWAAVMLVRSGITNIRLVDFDYVSLSSLNRHATAGTTDVGTSKVKCIEKALKQISKWVEVDARIEVWRKEEGGALLEDADWVIDAIDNIQTKVDLLKYCHDNQIKVFSSMGAGAKCDPTRIQISDISYTIYDPLARSVRRRLRLLGVDSGIPVVYSTEVPGDVKLLPLPEEEFQKGPVKELGVLDDFRVRILPVLGPLPAIFGLNIATYILCELAGKPISNPLPIKNRKKLYERIYRDLLHRESKIAGHQINKLSIDEDDVALIFEDLYRGRSVVPPHDVPSRPTLVRWDPSRPLSVDNCVVFELNDAEKHVKSCWNPDGSVATSTSPEALWGRDVATVVSRRSAEARRVLDWVM
ncbi:ubiquitin-protein ligase molybdopterin-converting factor [Pholiota conissans]|uniref:Ubiquitin-protein ligase molybdopterin-converting factor n=1 Tax=Pholiota conissans TaxID=109636 RepID=A0A9P5ZCQ3_9AGAR|nr:ubiquitin-protein ligase molybdopterin-converting factor [Pholiota conissans]